MKRRILLFLAVAGAVFFLLGPAPPAVDPPQEPQAESGAPGPGPGVTIRWRRIADLPEARRNLKIAALGGRVYALGGYAQPHRGMEAGCFRYDPVADTWSPCAPMPVGRSNFALAAADGRLYAIGGDKFLARGESYDPLADSWRAIAPMPTARQHINGAVLAGRIHVVGGRLSWSENPLEALSAVHEAFDTARGVWSVAAPLPRRSENPSLCVLRGKLYAVDGLDGALFAYDAAADAWSAGRKNSALGFIAGAAALLDRMFVLDAQKPGEEFSRVHVYDPGADSWSEATPLPLGVKLAGFAAAGGKLYAVGGCDPGFTAFARAFAGEIVEQGAARL